MQNPLNVHKKSVSSQHGEDGIIEAIFQTIDTANKWCVEFGAVDGRSSSNSWNLITNHGWSAVLIECHPGYFKKLQETHAENKKVQTLNLKVDFEGEYTLGNILARAGAPTDIDFVSIDIDGADYHIWDSLKNYRPRVVMIECNLRIPPDIAFISPRDLSKGYGSSLTALVALGKKKGYELVYAEEMNAVFVLKELFPRFGINDNSPAALGVFIEQEARFFQLFDGSVVLHGLPAEQVLLFKKKPTQPISVLKEGGLIPVSFQEKRISRIIKNAIKKSPFYYSFVEPIARRFYGARWKKKRASLKDS